MRAAGDVMSRLNGDDLVQATSVNVSDEDMLPLDDDGTGPLNLSLTSASDALGINTFDLAYGLLKTTARQQLRSAETWLAVVAEFLGTATVVFIVTAAIESQRLADWQSSTQAVTIVAAATGLAVYGVATGLMPHGLAFLNPALAWAGWILGVLDYIKLCLFAVAQLLGALLGAWAGWGLSPVTGRDDVAICTAIGADVSLGQAFILEFVLTFILTYTTAGSLLERKSMRARWTAVYAVASFLVVLVGGASTGGSTNPAKSLALAVIQTSCFDGYHWIYWLAPFAAATSAALMHQGLATFAIVDFYVGNSTPRISRASSFRG